MLIDRHSVTKMAPIATKMVVAALETPHELPLPREKPRGAQSVWGAGLASVAGALPLCCRRRCLSQWLPRQGGGGLPPPTVSLHQGNAEASFLSGAHSSREAPSAAAEGERLGDRSKPSTSCTPSASRPLKWPSAPYPVSPHPMG